MEKIFYQFLKEFGSRTPFLLALSGGPDSMALFHLLLDSRQPFAVAHVNHGWRIESEDEEKSITKLCHTFQIPFYLKRLDSSIPSNLEDACRVLRLQFFKEICESEQFCGVILGHHSDDQAETVLKRIFEGSSLQKLKGLSKVNKIQGLVLYRPLLEVTKKEILNYLSERKIPFFEDHTNHSSQFLRGRFRKEILPMLSKIFGKEISSSLCRLGDYAHDLDQFCESFLESWRKKKVLSKEGVSLDLSKAPVKSDFEWKLIVKDFFLAEGITLTNNSLDQLIEHLKKKNKNKKLCIGKKNVTICSGSIYITTPDT